MSPRMLAVALLLGVATAASAQQADQPFHAKYSLEIGTGLPPLHMGLISTRSQNETLADKGQEVNMNGASYPVISLSGVIRYRHRQELLVTVGTSWCHHQITQYGVFGTDPDGNPRYDLSQGTNVGWKNASPLYTINGQWRYILTSPEAIVQLYAGAGMGVLLTHTYGPIPLPTVTPIAVRVGGKYLYGFVECTLGTVASFVHGGLAFRFN